MNKERRYLEIKDVDIQEAIHQSNAWYSLATIINQELGIKDYQLWIGTLRWGDNDEKDIIAILKNGYVSFKCGEDETSTDLISFFIHSWLADEPIEVHFNGSIYKTVNLLDKNSKNDFNLYSDLFNEFLLNAPYSFHDGNLVI